MQLRERQNNGVTVIDVVGDLVMTDDNPSAIKEFVGEVLTRGVRRIVLNLSQLGRTDSTCLGEIVWSYQMTMKLGGSLKLAEPDPSFRHQLQVMHLDTVIEALETEAEAVTSFGAVV